MAEKSLSKGWDKFKVGDHDFTKFSMIPSVVLQSQIPEDVACSWYCGQVFGTLKEDAFEPSSHGSFVLHSG